MFNHFFVVPFFVIFFLIGFVFGINYGVMLSITDGPRKACESLRINLIDCEAVTKEVK